MSVIFWNAMMLFLWFQKSRELPKNSRRDILFLDYWFVGVLVGISTLVGYFMPNPLYAIHIYQPLHSGRIWHEVNFKAEFNRFEFRVFPYPRLVAFTKAEEPSLSYYLPIAGGGIIGFIPFPRVLVRCEMQSVSSRIWTRVVVSISYADNHYTDTSIYIYIYIYIWFLSE